MHSVAVGLCRNLYDSREITPATQCQPETDIINYYCGSSLHARQHFCSANIFSWRRNAPTHISCHFAGCVRVCGCWWEPWRLWMGIHQIQMVVVVMQRVCLVYETTTKSHGICVMSAEFQWAKSGFLFCSLFACGKDHTQLNYLQNSVHEFDTVMSCRQHRPGTFFSPFPGVLYIISCHHKFIIASHTFNSHPNSMTFVARHIPTISKLMAIACDGAWAVCANVLDKIAKTRTRTQIHTYDVALSVSQTKIWCDED